MGEGDTMALAETLLPVLCGLRDAVHDGGGQ
jgi:hypothetical protein